MSGITYVNKRSCLISQIRAFTQKEFPETGCSKVNSGKSYATGCKSMNEELALLYAEVRLGELLEVQTSHGGSLNYKSGANKSLPEGISHKQSHYAQELLDKIPMKRDRQSSSKGTSLPSLPPGKTSPNFGEVAREMLSSTWEDQERSTDGKFVPPDKTWNQYYQGYKD